MKNVFESITFFYVLDLQDSLKFRKVLLHFRQDDGVSVYFFWRSLRLKSILLIVARLSLLYFL